MTATTKPPKCSRGKLSTLKRTLSIAVLVIVVLTAVSAALFLFLQPKTSTLLPSLSIEKFKASGYYADSEGAFLLMDAGNDKGFCAGHGLSPEFITIPGRAILAADIGEQVASGIKIGFSIPSEIILARSAGVPVKIVAGYVGEAPAKVFVRTDGPVKTVRDLDGKKIGVVSTDHFTYRMALFLANKFSVKMEPIPVGDLPSNIAALKTGRIDAIIYGTPNAVALLLVESGEFRVALEMRDVLPEPFVSLVAFATDDLMERDPELVRKFVQATLQTAKYLKENPDYASVVYGKRTAAPKDLSDRAVSQLDWRPNGRGSGSDLLPAVTNVWQYNMESGAVPADRGVRIQNTVDTKFLP